jgi:hypothetical protein
MTETEAAARVEGLSCKLALLKSPATGISIGLSRPAVNSARILDSRSSTKSMFTPSSLRVVLSMQTSTADTNFASDLQEKANPFDVHILLKSLIQQRSLEYFT